MKIKRRTNKTITSKDILEFIILFVLIEGMLESLGAPHAIAYILDLCVIALLFFLIKSNRLAAGFRYKLSTLQTTMLTIGILVAVYKGVRIPLIIWSIRAYGRFVIYFVACVVFLTVKDVLNIYELLEKMFVLDAILIVAEYLVGYRQDDLGGIFGVSSGVNAYNNVLIIIICSITLAKWFAGIESSAKTGIIVITSVGIAVLSEVKVVLFELVAIVLVELIVSLIIANKWKTVIKGFFILLFAGVLLISAASIIAKLYPNKSNLDFLSIEGLQYILMRDSGYSGAGDLNRLTAISTINKLPIFADSLSNRLLGLGQGATDYSSAFGFFQSSFYHQYQYLRYYWFLHAWIYLENGLVGLMLYVAALFSNVIAGIRYLKNGTDDHDYIIMAGVSVSFISMILCIYNPSLRVESAYLIYFPLAALFVQARERRGHGREICNQSAGSQHYCSGI